MNKPEGYRNPRVNAAPEAAVDNPFNYYLPKQIEHCLRLTLERLQMGLDKRADKPMSNPEVAALAQSAQALYDIYYTLHND